MNHEGNVLPDGKLEALEAQTQKYLSEASDQMFTEYLIKLKERIRNQKYQVDLLQDELDRSYQMYLRRKELAERPVGSNPVGEVPANMQVNMPANMQVNPPVNVPVNIPSVNETTAVKRIEEPARIPASAPIKKTEGGAEFIVGTAILSIVGGAFILTALVMLTMYFMNGFVKGMCLYAGAILLLLISELLIYRKLPKLATVFSAIGIGGLYLSTVLNFLTLHNFGIMATIIITMLITLFAILLSRKRDSFVYRILGLVASYLCLLTVGEDISTIEFCMLSGMILLINMVCILIPIRKYKTAFNATHMCSNLVFAFLMDWRLGEFVIPIEFRLLLIIGLLLIMQMLLFAQMKHEQKEMAVGNRVANTVLKVFYAISAVGLTNILGDIFWENMLYTEMLRYGSVAAVAVICIVACLALRKYSVKWYPYYLMNLCCLNICWCTENDGETIICLLVLLVIAKILSLWRIPALKLCDAFLTSVTCLYLLAYMDENSVYTYVLLAGVVISVFFISQWQTYFEILLTYTLAIFAVAQLGGMLKLPVFTGILFVGMLLFNNISRFRGKHIVVFNGFALAGEVICFLLLLNPVYQNAYLTYLIMLVFGLATIVLTFQEKYHMNFKCKNMIMALFLTYMAIIIRTNLPVINSILLMVIALVCVGVGFVVKEKAVRIYGLVLSLLVCVKIVLYDYIGVSTLQRTVLFFAVGVIALIIAGIYIILEKKNTKS